MARVFLFGLSLLLCAFPVSAQSQSQTRFTAAPHATAPTTCNPGDLYTKTGASAGLKLCTAANTWTDVATGLGGGGGVGTSSTTEILFNNAGTVDGNAKLTFTTVNDNLDDAAVTVSGASPSLRVQATNVTTEPAIWIGNTDEPTGLFLAKLGNDWSNLNYVDMANSSLIWDQHNGVDSHGLILTTDNCDMHFTSGGHTFATETLRLNCDNILGIGPMTGVTQAGMPIGLQRDSTAILAVMNGQSGGSREYRDLRVRNLYVEGEAFFDFIANNNNPLTIENVATFQFGIIAQQYVDVGSFVSGLEIAEPAAPGANGYRLFSKDNGSGKTQLCVRFASGVSQCFASEP